MGFYFNLYKDLIALNASLFVESVGKKLSGAKDKKKKEETPEKETPNWDDEELSKVRKEYIAAKPIKKDAIAMRLVEIFSLNRNIGRGIEFIIITNNGEIKSFFAIDNDMKIEIEIRDYLGRNVGVLYKRAKDFYRLPEDVRKVCVAFSYIIPRLEDGKVELNYVERIYSSKKDKIDYDVSEYSYNNDYNDLIIKPEEISKLSEAEYEKFVTVISNWDELALQCLGSEIYDGWRPKIVELFKQVEERRNEGELYEPNRMDNKQPEVLYRNLEEEKRQAIIKAGQKGEDDVEYELKWLGDNYVSLRNDVDRIRLYDKEIGEGQEIDHILITAHMVLVIETKNLGGNIEIKPNGNWMQDKDRNGQWKGIRNPSSQVKRHHKVVKKILDDSDYDIPIFDVICISNSSTIISGDENSKIPIVKVDVLGDYIENIENQQSGNMYDIESVKKAILDYNVEVD